MADAATNARGAESEAKRFARKARDEAEAERLQRDALRHWNAGEYHLCLSLLEELPAERQASQLLAARALLRVGRYGEAERRLADGLLLHRTPDAIATHAMLVGVARGRADDFGGADAWFARARAAHPHRSIVAETDYEQALTRYQAGRFDSAREIVAGALRPSEDIIYARALSLLGWIETARGDYRRAFERFSEALVALRDCRARDTYLEGSTTHALAILCAETGLGEPSVIENYTANIRWTSNMTLAHSQTLRHLGLAYQRRGDVERAVSLFVASAEAADGTAWAIVAHADCANAAHLMGETLGTSAFVTKSVAMAERVGAAGWHSIDGEKRVSLLVLAEVLARTGDAARAVRYRGLYDERPGISSMNALSHDRRLPTYREHVDALVMGALGNRRGAVAALAKVAERWSAIGYVARATEARRDAARLTDADTPVLSPLPEARRPLRQPARILRLRDEEMLRMVVDGSDDAAIAARFHLSRRTVRNIVYGMYAHFGVRNRAQLVAAASRRSGSRSLKG